MLHYGFNKGFDRQMDRKLITKKKCQTVSEKRNKAGKRNGVEQDLTCIYL